jgi:hypothetical protein
MTKQPEAREPDQPLALSSSAVLGPNVLERRECDAPICPWCGRQGWDTCGSYYDTYTCEARL